ncbi:hypothetical protein QOT17_003844 [Balamuthia mandrillaris]
MLEHLLVISHEGDIVLSEQFVMISAATVPVATKEAERYEWEHNIYILSREMWSYVIESKEREVIVTGDKNILFTAEGDFLVFVTGSGDYDCLALNEIMDSLLEVFQLICRTASKRLCCETLVHEYMRLKMALDFMFSAKGEVEFLVAEQSIATTSLEMKELLAYAKKRKLTSMKSPRSGGSGRPSSSPASPAPSSSSSSVAVSSSTTKPTLVPGMLSAAPPAPHIMNLRSPRREGGSTSPISTSATLLVSPTTSMEMLGSKSPRMAVSSKEVPSRGGTLRSKSQRKSVSFEVYPLNLETVMMDPSMQELHETTPGEKTAAATETPPLTSSNKEVKTSKSNNKGIARTSEWVASSSDGSHHHYSSSEEGAQEEGKKQEIGRQRKDSAKHAEDEALAALVNAEVERSVKEGDQSQQQTTNIGRNIDDTPFLEEEEEQEERDKKETGLGVDSGDSQQQLLVDYGEAHGEGAEPKQEHEQRLELVVEERQQLFLKVERKSQKFDGKKLAALTNEDSLIFRGKHGDEELSSSSTTITRSRSTTPSAFQQDDEDSRGRRNSKSKESESSRHKLKDDDRSSSQSRERRDSKREHRDKDRDRERGGTYRDSKHRKGSRAHDKDLESTTKAHNKRDRGEGQEQKERSASIEPEREKDRATPKEKDGRGDKDRAEGRERKPSRHGTLRETNPKTDQGASRRHSRGMEGEMQQQP